MNKFKIKWWHLAILITLINYIAVLFGFINLTWYEITMPVLIFIGFILLLLIMLIVISVFLKRKK